MPNTKIVAYSIMDLNNKYLNNSNKFVDMTHFMDEKN